MRLFVATLTFLFAFPATLFSQGPMWEAFHRDRTFKPIKYFEDPGKENGRDVQLQLLLHQVQLQSRRGEVLKSFHYSDISSTSYAFSRRPPWNEGTPWSDAHGPSSLRRLLRKADRCWYKIQVGDESILLRLDRSHSRQVTEAIDKGISAHRIAPSHTGQDASRNAEEESPPSRVFVSMAKSSSSGSGRPSLIEEGMTTSQVERIAGKPESTSMRGGTLLYHYADMVVEFDQDKVSDVHFR